jgi:hypothetical protein
MTGTKCKTENSGKLALTLFVELTAWGSIHNNNDALLLINSGFTNQ